MRTQRVLATSLTLATLLFAVAVPAFGATAVKPKPVPPPAAFITWQALSVRQPGYVGKTLPNRTSPIKASVFVIKENTLADLSAAPIRWYINNIFFTGGKGMTNVTIPADSVLGSRLNIRVVIERFLPDDLIATTLISRNPPVVALTLPPRETLRSGTLTLIAVPHFFTDTQGEPLQYRWNVDGQIRSVVDNMLVLDTQEADSDQPVRVSVETTNPQNPIETATTELTLYIP